MEGGQRGGKRGGGEGMGRGRGREGRDWKRGGKEAERGGGGKLYLLHVDTTSEQIGGDEDSARAGSELVQDDVTLLLANVTVLYV